MTFIATQPFQQQYFSNLYIKDITSDIVCRGFYTPHTDQAFIIFNKQD